MAISVFCVVVNCKMEKSEHCYLYRHVALSFTKTVKSAFHNSSDRCKHKRRPINLQNVQWYLMTKNKSWIHTYTYF